jgi:hypothetical protein
MQIMMVEVLQGGILYVFMWMCIPCGDKDADDGWPSSISGILLATKDLGKVV